MKEKKYTGYVQFSDDNSTIIATSSVIFVKKIEDGVVIALNTFSGLHNITLKGVDLKEVKKLLEI